MPSKSMNLKGLACPLPVLRANKEIRKLGAGDELECTVTDPAAPEDFANFCESAGHTLLSCVEESDFWTISLRKGN